MPILALRRRERKGKESSRSKIGGKQKKKIPDQRSEENKRNIQKGLWTRHYLNSTELSQVNKKRKPRLEVVLSL